MDLASVLGQAAQPGLLEAELLLDHPKRSGCSRAAARSLSSIDPVPLSTVAPESAQIAMTAMDLSGRMGHAEDQVVPPLAAGSDHLAAALAT